MARQNTLNPTRAADDAVSPYMPQLDGLRAVAIALVFLSHLAPERLARAAPWGVVGVRLFFVLSGFLITGILLRCRQLADDRRVTTGGAAARFYGRRFLRIFPVYYATLAVAVLMNVGEIRPTIRWHVFYATNVYMTRTGRWPGAATPFWSLAAEEQFYLIWPWVILLLPRRALRGAMIGSVVLGAAALFTTLALGWEWSRINTDPLAALPSLGLGGLLALFCDRRWGDPRRRADLCRRAALVGLVFFLFGGAARFFYDSQQLKTVGFILGASGMSVWVIDRASRGFGGWAGRLLGLRPVLYIGRISYGMYVVHMFAEPVLARAFGAGWLSWVSRHGPLYRMAVLTLWSVAAASASWHLMEAPINRLKRFIPYAPRRTTAAGGADPAPPGLADVRARPSQVT